MNPLRNRYRLFRGDEDSKKGGNIMIGWAATFLIIAIIAGIFGLSGVAGMAANIAWILFVVGLIIALVFALVGRRPPL